MNFWNAYDKVVGATRDQTISDDATSRLARAQAAERNKMQRVEVDPETGEPLLYFDITVVSLGGIANVPLTWAARDTEHARETFLDWIQSDEWHTVEYSENGAASELTFRGSWVAGFKISLTGRRRR